MSLMSSIIKFNFNDEIFDLSFQRHQKLKLDFLVSFLLAQKPVRLLILQNQFSEILKLRVIFHLSSVPSFFEVDSFLSFFLPGTDYKKDFGRSL